MLNVLLNVMQFELLYTFTFVLNIHYISRNEFYEIN